MIWKSRPDWAKASVTGGDASVFQVPKTGSPVLSLIFNLFVLFIVLT